MRRRGGRICCRRKWFLRRGLLSLALGHELLDIETFTQWLDLCERFIPVWGHTSLEAEFMVEWWARGPVEVLLDQVVEVEHGIEEKVGFGAEWTEGLTV